MTIFCHLESEIQKHFQNKKRFTFNQKWIKPNRVKDTEAKLLLNFWARFTPKKPARGLQGELLQDPTKVHRIHFLVSSFGSMAFTTGLTRSKTTTSQSF